MTLFALAPGIALLVLLLACMILSGASAIKPGLTSERKQDTVGSEEGLAEAH